MARVLLVGLVVTVLAVPILVLVGCFYERELRLLAARLQRWRHRKDPAAEPDQQSLDVLAADLHRLAVHLAAVEHTEEPAKMARLQAAALAYDAVLIDALRVLEIPAPPASPLDSWERLQAEAVLAQHGLEW